MAKLIAIYNHKGGVGKTTLTFHLSWMLAQLGKRVLMVDTDPQCNLTGLTLGKGDNNKLEAFYESEENPDVFHSLGYKFEFLHMRNKEKVRDKITPTENPNLFILAGNIRFSELDTQISTALTLSKTMPIMRPLVGVLGRRIREIAEKNKIDLVIMDLSPDIFGANQALLMTTDYFVLPVAPDYFCYQSSISLARLFPQWLKTMDYFRNIGENSIPNDPPKFLGYVVQQFNKGDLDEEQAKEYASIMRILEDTIEEKLVMSLKKFGMVASEEELGITRSSQERKYRISLVENFGELVPISQEISKPIFEIEKKDVDAYTNNERPEHFRMVVSAQQVFESIAKSVLRVC